MKGHNTSAWLSVMRGTTAPAAPSLLMLKTCQPEAPKYITMVGFRNLIAFTEIDPTQLHSMKEERE